MMSLEQNFWRLFGNYEDLTRDQTTAIGEWNFAALKSIHEKKDIILAELVRIADLLKLDRGQPVLKKRLALLIEAEQRNTVLMSEELAKTRRESEVLNAAAKRLRAIEHSYGGDARQGNLAGAFRAHG